MQPFTRIQCDVPPYLLSGIVYTSLLNHQPQLAALGREVDDAPYKGAPRGPVLGIKPRNTLAFDGESIVIPSGFDSLMVGATLGLVIGRTASCVSVSEAAGYLSGYLIANDLGLPHQSHYRPAVRLLARDGFCPLGSRVIPAALVPHPDDLEIRVLIDGELRQTTTTGQRIRNVSQLLSDVTEFMTLQPGDLLLIGTTLGAPEVHAGQTLEIQVDDLGSLTNHFVRDLEAL